MARSQNEPKDGLDAELRRATGRLELVVELLEKRVAGIAERKREGETDG